MEEGKYSGWKWVREKRNLWERSLYYFCSCVDDLLRYGVTNSKWPQALLLSVVFHSSLATRSCGQILPCQTTWKKWSEHKVRRVMCTQSWREFFLMLSWSNNGFALWCVVVTSLCPALKFRFLLTHVYQKHACAQNTGKQWRKVLEVFDACSWVRHCHVFQNLNCVQHRIQGWVQAAGFVVHQSRLISYSPNNNLMPFLRCQWGDWAAPSVTLVRVCCERSPVTRAWTHQWEGKHKK